MLLPPLSLIVDLLLLLLPGGGDASAIPTADTLPAPPAACVGSVISQDRGAGGAPFER